MAMMVAELNSLLGFDIQDPVEENHGFHRTVDAEDSTLLLKICCVCVALLDSRCFQVTEFDYVGMSSLSKSWKAARAQFAVEPDMTVSTQAHGDLDP